MNQFWLSDKESVCNEGDAGNGGSVPGLGRSPGGGHVNPLQYSCLENPMDREAFDLEADLFASLCHTTVSALLIWVEILWEHKFSFC